MMVPYYVVSFLCLFSIHCSCSSKFFYETPKIETVVVIEYEVDTGWIPASSKAIALGDHIRLRCSISNTSGTLLLCKRKEAKAVREVLISSNQSGMIWGIDHAKFGDSGLYECVSGSFSDVMIIHVYKRKFRVLYVFQNDQLTFCFRNRPSLTKETPASIR